MEAGWQRLPSVTKILDIIPAKKKFGMDVYRIKPNNKDLILKDAIDNGRSVICLVDCHAVVLLRIKNEQYEFKNSCGKDNPEIIRKPVIRNMVYKFYNSDTAF